MPPKRLKRTGRKARDQIRGTKKNAVNVATDIYPDDVLPAGIRGFIAELLYLFPRAFGRGTARQQIISTVTLGIIAVIASPLSGGVLLLALVPLAFLFLWGVLRLVPAVNNGWNGVRSRVPGLDRNRNIPGWRRE